MHKTLTTSQKVPVGGPLTQNHHVLAGYLFGEIAVELGFCSQDAVNDALTLQTGEDPQRLGEILSTQGHLDAAQIAQVLAAQLEMPFREQIDIDSIPDELIQNVPIGFAKQHRMLPLELTEEGVIAALADPLNTEALDDLSLLLQTRPLPVIALETTIAEAINRVYDRATGLASEAAAQLVDSSEDEEEDLDANDLLVDNSDDDAPIIRFVNALLRDAVKARASDIHVEAYERSVVVRNRIDGILYRKVEVPKHAHASITARVKIMSGLNIAEKRLPQDGRIRRRIAGKDIDVRVSTVPTSHGERVVMRILDRSGTLLSLDDLGFSEQNRGDLESLIRRPHGIILVSGPTGSGKTTTLYAALSRINSPDINILTVEDPVEYQLSGVGQMQVQSKIDLTFASGLRAFLRQDPDVIMVGEIRDRETAEIAIQASLTGHLVLSTVHTNDAPGAVTRLVDMGVEPFLVSSTLIGVLAQRLVRNLCRTCKQPYKPTPDQLLEIGLAANDTSAVFHRKVGCGECLETGYRGRSGIYELLVVDDEVKRLILKNVDSGTVKRYATQNTQMRTLLQDGVRKVLAGHTTPEEILRVAKDEQVVA